MCVRARVCVAAEIWGLFVPAAFLDFLPYLDLFPATLCHAENVLPRVAEVSSAQRA